MKKLNAVTQGLVVGLVAVIALSGCSRTSFMSVAPSLSLKTDIPMDPEPVTGPVFGYKLSNGECKSDSSTQLLACAKCNVPQIQLQPQLSKKAQALLDVMLLACGVPNKSDLTDVRPTHAMILNKLNQASELNYPESFRSSDTEILLQGLNSPIESESQSIDEDVEKMKKKKKEEKGRGFKF